MIHGMVWLDRTVDIKIYTLNFAPMLYLYFDWQCKDVMGTCYMPTFIAVKIQHPQSMSGFAFISGLAVTSVLPNDVALTFSSSLAFIFASVSIAIDVWA